MSFSVSQIRKYVFKYINSNMYILIEGKNALIVDPHMSEDANRYLTENSIENVTILLTHEHFDHCNGIPFFRDRYSVSIICQESALKKKSQKWFNQPLLEAMRLHEEGKADEAIKLEQLFPPFFYAAERTFTDGLTFEWEGHHITLVSSPGHSPASCIIKIDDNLVFTGDSLIPDNEPTLKWPLSDKDVFYDVTLPLLLSIDGEDFVCPGHGEIIQMKSLVYEAGKFINKGEKWQ